MPRVLRAQAGPALPGAPAERGARRVGSAAWRGRAGPEAHIKGRPCNACAFLSINGISCPLASLHPPRPPRQSGLPERGDEPLPARACEEFQGRSGFAQGRLRGSLDPEARSRPSFGRVLGRVRLKGAAGGTQGGPQFLSPLTFPVSAPTGAAFDSGLKARRLQDPTCRERFPGTLISHAPARSVSHRSSATSDVARQMGAGR